MKLSESLDWVSVENLLPIKFGHYINDIYIINFESITNEIFNDFKL